MGVKNRARSQISQQIDTATSGAVRGLTVPQEGWVATTRKALAMSGAQLARRVGFSRKRISQAEKAKREGGITLRSMHQFAEALGGRFVYAIVPNDGTIDDILKRQANKKASALVSRVSTHMALEQQALGETGDKKEINQLAYELARDLPFDFWDEP
ncbi:MAG: mobile mystery protein A [Alphaproteobacteria bacterium GM202ARS2]|nr:mobile mystery protein A [Alphaproteobacteria bacterium GM202ARS2]